MYMVPLLPTMISAGISAIKVIRSDHQFDIPPPPPILTVDFKCRNLAHKMYEKFNKQ